MLSSFIYDRFKTKKEIAEFLNEIVDQDEEEKALKEIKNDKSLDKQDETKLFKPLREYFSDNQNKSQRDGQIFQAHKDGWSQGKIAKEIGISQPAVFKVIRKFRENDLLIKN